MNVGSLFSGIGGIEHGLENAGFSTNWFIESDDYARAILTKQFPHAYLYGDITKIDFRTVPKVDILTGGFPCQDISNAGKRIGITGSRSSLWKYYLKAIREIRPKYAVIENVSALTYRGLNVVLADLAKVGYDAEWHCVPAVAVGAPHRRERLFIIAYASSRGGDREQRKESTCKTWRNNDVAHSDIIRNRSSLGQEENGWRTEKQTCAESFGTGSNVEHSKGEFRETPRYSIGKEKDYTRLGIANKDAGKHTSRGWWAAEPDVGRMADGVPFRVDRIRCLGNAVVPQVAEIFARAIKIKEKKP